MDLSCLQENLLPKQSEVKEKLGDQLASVIFEFSHEEIKKYLGLSPSLTGPEKELWISPSDQLIEKKCLKAPIHSDNVKACTHYGILEIGEQALTKFCKEMEERFQEKLNEELFNQKSLDKAAKRRAVDLALRKTREQYRNCVLKLKCRFRQKLKNELEKAMAECREKMEEAILEERANITREMMKKLRDEIGFVVISLYHDFQLKLYAVKQTMIAEFNQIMRYDRLRTNAMMKEVIRQKDEDFHHKLQELELQKIVDLTYVLCSERMRCSAEKHEMHQSFEKQVEALQKMLLEANRTIKLMKEEPCISENNKTLESKIMEIVKQFQRFINFAFGAVPGQAEYFLSLESLLTLELNQKISQGKEERKTDLNGIFEVVEIIDKCGRKWKPIQLIPDIQQPTIIESEEILRKGRNGSFQSHHSSHSISFCHYENQFFERADFQAGDMENETKTLTELAEDSRFVMDIKQVKTSNLEMEQNHEMESQSTGKLTFEFLVNKEIKSQLPENLLESVKVHNQMIKSVTEKNTNGKRMFKIVGDDGIEHLQTPKQFRISRMKSLLRIFKLHPSLQHILIPRIGAALY